MKSSAGRRCGLIAPSTADQCSEDYRENGKLNGLHKAGKQPVEMNQNRAELQGGLHGHPVARILPENEKRLRTFRSHRDKHQSKCGAVKRPR